MKNNKEVIEKLFSEYEVSNKESLIEKLLKEGQRLEEEAKKEDPEIRARDLAERMKDAGWSNNISKFKIKRRGF